MQTKQLMKFIRTKATPHIFFRPKIANGVSDKKLKETHDTLQGLYLTLGSRGSSWPSQMHEVTYDLFQGHSKKFG